jgi:hypothetical protein
VSAGPVDDGDNRTFAHPPSRMLGVLEERGLRRTFAHHPVVWEIAGLERNLSRQVF